MQGLQLNVNVNKPVNMEKIQTKFNNSHNKLLNKRLKLSETIMLGVKELQLHEQLHRETAMELFENTRALVEQDKLSENEYLEFAKFLKEKINYTTTNFQTRSLLNFSVTIAETPSMSRFLQHETLREQRRLECIRKRKEMVAKEKANEKAKDNFYFRIAQKQMKVQLDELDTHQKAVRKALQQQKHTKEEKKILSDALKAKQMAEKEKLILSIQLEDMRRFNLCAGTGKHSRTKMLVYQDIRTGQIQQFYF